MVTVVAVTPGAEAPPPPVLALDEPPDDGAVVLFEPLLPQAVSTTVSVIPTARKRPGARSAGLTRRGVADVVMDPPGATRPFPAGMGDVAPG
ncbi:MAG TPA: hypothetical protein VGN54_06285 [Mycobacteriales bacterium]|nr:hypothetical protein [Mycobacteriales bacterium]